MRGKYAVIDLRNMDFLKNEEGNMALFDTDSEALLACGVYECEDAWVVKLVYNHVEGNTIGHFIAMDVLLDRLNNFKEALENPVLEESLEERVELQVFRTIIGDKEYIEEYKEKHKKDILLAIIYSIRGVAHINGNKMYCMSGFVQQKRRLPNENDRIIRGRNYFTQVNGSFLSSIAFEII